MRVILVSDTHLSPSAPQAQANWEAVLRYIGAAAPDVVIHLGDLTQDGPHRPDDLPHGRRQLDRLPVPWHAVPGNHDIGDNPWPGAAGGSTVDPGRRQRWLDVIGVDRWSLTIEGWRMLAINAQLLGSGLEAEAEQWSWLEQQVSERNEDRRLALLTHKPLTSTSAEMASSPPYRFLPSPGRERLADLVKAPLVISGHVHQYRLLHCDGADHLWVPTTWAVLPDHMQPVMGAKLCGIVELELSAGTRPQPQVIEPDGLAQLTLTRDLPDPSHP